MSDRTQTTTAIPAQAGAHRTKSVSRMTTQPTEGAAGSAKRTAASVVLLAGLWVAISPYVLLPGIDGSRVTVHNVIVGLAAAVIALAAIVGTRGFAELQIPALGIGIWLIISPFLLDSTLDLADDIFWSNVVAGVVVVVFAVMAMAPAKDKSGEPSAVH